MKPKNWGPGRMFLVDELGSWHISGESSTETSDFTKAEGEGTRERCLCREDG